MGNGHVLGDVLVPEHLIRDRREAIEAEVELRLPRSACLVVLQFDIDARGDHLAHDLSTEVLQPVHGGNGKVAALEARPVAQVRPLLAGVPNALLAVDLVESEVGPVVEADTVEYEALRLWSEVGRLPHS